MASVLAALAAAAGVVFTGLSLQATRSQNAITEQGQLTDRFTKAVDQLDRAGTDHLQARLGAIYALERLARDSPRDLPTVVEVLSAFVRSTAHRPLVDGLAGSCPDQPPAVDVQAALTVLGRRNTDYDPLGAAAVDFGAGTVDLSQTCLRHADLARADLARADLHQTDLTKATLIYAHLRSAYLVDADLGGAGLLGADLGDAALSRADLGGAHLVFANLRGAYLVNASLVGADLGGTFLTDATLLGADLTGAKQDEKTTIDGVKIDKDTKGAWWG